ncbi:SDR family NAD(P)-dependent oxidoreductase [Sphingomonas sp. TX0543]|uniref:SDR family NAD(P)-dependent oxidoreductase n=1 Tax=Sphingomonas sp. TX0543 TaxID=3399682 RepID=UPI003AFB3AB5
MNISECTSVVTGGASGLGEATARALAWAGAKVSIFDLNEEAGTRVAETIGGVFCRVDVTNEASVTEGFAKARLAHGQERILVNCAGTGSAWKTAWRSREDGEIRHFPLDKFQQMIQINLVGTFICIAKSTAGMLQLEPLLDAARGVVVNTASVAAEDGQVGQAAYSASKAGIVGMTLAIARDFMNDGIRVNTILPGTFDTPLIHSAPDAVKQALIDNVPFPRRMGYPAEYASLVLEMCRNPYFNGEDVRLDGALRMPPR